MTATRQIAAMGMAVTAPPGWEAAIYRRQAVHGAITYPVMHAATIALPASRADYGGGLLEFGPEAASTPLFSALRSVPGLTPDAFRPQQLQRTIRGQAGVQRFFSVGGRAFCLYAVLGSIANRVKGAARANELIGSFRIDPGSPS
jgi:hypothetical protein